MEHLTDEIERRALDYIERIDEMGGAVEAVEAGFVQREIQQAAYEFQKAVESGQRVVVGVNKFVSESDPPKDILRVDPKVREEQMAALAKLRESRDNQAVQAKLAALETAAKQDQNIMPPVVDCVRVYATLGEICDCLRGVFGEYQAPSTI